MGYCHDRPLGSCGSPLSREVKSPSRESCFASTTRHAEASKSSSRA
jgi:hypothetical protein